MIALPLLRDCIRHRSVGRNFPNDETAGGARVFSLAHFDLAPELVALAYRHELEPMLANIVEGMLRMNGACFPYSGPVGEGR